MKILVLSDSHHHKNMVSEIICNNKNADVIVFLGDGINDFEDALAENGLSYENTRPEIVAVLGNCDRFGRSGDHMVRNFGGIDFYITHGAAENVKMGLWSLVTEAKNFDCKIALYGHTHVQSCIDKDGIKCFNPGAVERGEYGIIEIENKEAKFEMKKQSW